MGRMRHPPLEHQATRVVREYYGKMRRLSGATRDKYLRTVALFAAEVRSKYGLQNLANLKSKHVQGVFHELVNRGLSPSTLSIYATAARMIANAIGKQNIVPRTNKELGFTRRGDRLKPVSTDTKRQAEIRKALYDRAEWLGLAHDMRAAFGLRCRESLLSGDVVRHVDGRESLVVRGAKGGRPRTVEIRTDKQRDVITRVREYMERHNQTSLVPLEMSLREGMAYQRRALQVAGARRQDGTHAHALRHAYAQQRIQEGALRGEVAAELGHGREDVVSHYVP